MDLILDILAVMAIVLGGLLVLVLVAPIRARAEGRASAEGLTGRFRCDWARGILGIEGSTEQPIRVRVFGIPFRIERPPKDPSPRRPKKEKPGRSRQRRRLSWEGTRALLRLGRRLVAACGLRLSVRGVAGLPDPADSAMMFLVLDLAGRTIPGLEVDVEPDWVDETIDLEGTGRLYLRPIRLLWTAAAWWLTDREGRQALRGGAR